MIEPMTPERLQWMRLNNEDAKRTRRAPSLLITGDIDELLAEVDRLTKALAEMESVLRHYQAHHDCDCAGQQIDDDLD